MEDEEGRQRNRNRKADGGREKKDENGKGRKWAEERMEDREKMVDGGGRQRNREEDGGRRKKMEDGEERERKGEDGEER